MTKRLVKWILGLTEVLGLTEGFLQNFQNTYPFPMQSGYFLKKKFCFNLLFSSDANSVIVTLTLTLIQFLTAMCHSVEVCVFEVCVFEVCVFEVCVFEVCVFEVCVFEVCVFEVCVFEVCGLRFRGLRSRDTRKH